MLITIQVLNGLYYFLGIAAALSCLEVAYHYERWYRKTRSPDLSMVGALRGVVLMTAGVGGVILFYVIASETMAGPPVDPITFWVTFIVRVNYVLATGYFVKVYWKIAGRELVSVRYAGRGAVYAAASSPGLYLWWFA